MAERGDCLLSTDESTDLVRRMLGGAIRAEVFMLRDGEIVGRLTVDPEIAQAALAEAGSRADG